MVSLRVLLLAIYAVCGVLGDYDFQVRLYRYTNPSSNCQGCGGCCDPGESVCTCDNLFQFCLRDLGTPATSRSLCSFTSNTQPVQSDDIFFESAGIFPNSMLDITKSGPWTGVQFYMEVIDFDSSTARQFVDSFAINVNSPISSSYSARMSHTGLHNIGTLELDYRILCADDFYGTDCSVFCRPMMDINGVQMYSCNSDGSRNCLNGYIGELCNERNRCGELAVNCNNGQCVSNPLGCICDAGYTGTFCDGNIDDCVGVTCSSRGNCRDGVGTYTCDCDSGYTGSNCETEINECEGVDCSGNGQCIDSLAAYVCVCNESYTGTDCETRIDSCLTVNCSGNGVCESSVDSFSCVCALGFTGDLCEDAINTTTSTITDDCLLSNCSSNSLCVNQTNCKAEDTSIPELDANTEGTLSPQSSMHTLIASIAGAVGGFILVVITGIVVLVIVLAVYKYQLRATDKSGADPKSIEAAADIHVQKNLVYGVHRKNFFANKSTEPSIELKSNIVYGVPNLKKSDTEVHHYEEVLPRAR